MNIKGFHGTSENSANSILLNGFKPSKSDVEWLGDGVYFFVDGLCKTPKDKSREWALAQSWDNKAKANIYNKYSIIESDIDLNEKCLLDLTSPDGIEIFEYLKERFKNSIKKSSRKFVYLDGLMINLAIKKDIFPLDIVKGNFYIKFTKERIEQINFRTPNCTIFNVINLKKILSSKIVETKTI